MCKPACKGDILTTAGALRKAMLDSSNASSAAACACLLQVPVKHRSEGPLLVSGIDMPTDSANAYSPAGIVPSSESSLSTWLTDCVCACVAQVAKHVTAVQQRAAVLGCGPSEWAVGARCQARAGPNQDWQKAVIRGVSPAGKFLVDWLPSAMEECFQVIRDLRMLCTLPLEALQYFGIQVNTCKHT